MIGTELLKGQGLGNQLFCYVTTRCIAKERGEDFAILGGETLANNIHSDCGLYFMDLDLGVPAKKEDFKGTYYEKEDRLYTGKSKHDMTHGAYVTDTDEGMFKTESDMLLFGNMQAEDYFIKYKEDIKEAIEIVKDIGINSIEIYTGDLNKKSFTIKDPDGIVIQFIEI